MIHGAANPGRASRSDSFTTEALAGPFAGAPPLLFFLGTHQSSWLASASVPLFISARRLRNRRALPRANAPWALDSGAFTELKDFGRFRTPPAVYAKEAARWCDEIGKVRFCAVQDWMCEPFMLPRTGLSISEHQQRTLASYRDLLALAPAVPWLPVLQGWALDHYLFHLDMYDAAGIDLRALPLVGLGSVCRRQGTSEARRIILRLAREGLRLHLFGFKLTGLPPVARLAASADSMAWSFDARRAPPLPGCKTHKNCANCLRYALSWRTRVLDAISQGEKKDVQEEVRFPRAPLP